MTTSASMPAISTVLFYPDLDKASEFLCAAFGFEERVADRVTDDQGQVHHAELAFGNGLIILSLPYDELTAPAPDANHHQLTYVIVPDATKHCAHAQQAGATVTYPLRDTDYGARTYGCRDHAGHHWIFAQQL